MAQTEKLAFPEKTDAELKQLAVDIMEHQVFTDRHIREHDHRLVGSIFMPIALGAFANFSKEELKKVGMIYEYFGTQSPAGINGYPIFYSFKFLSIEQTKVVDDYFSEYRKLKDGFIKT